MCTAINWLNFFDALFTKFMNDIFSGEPFHSAPRSCIAQYGLVILRLQFQAQVE